MCIIAACSQNPIGEQLPTTMPKKRSARSAVIAYRPWPIPAVGFPIEEFDHVPDHALAGKLNNYCERWVAAKYGGRDGWERHLVEGLLLEARRRNAIAKQTLIPGPGTRIPSAEECLAEVQSNKRTLLERLDDEPGVIMRHSRPGIYVNTSVGAFQVGPRRRRMHFVDDVPDIDDGLKIAKYLNDRGARVPGIDRVEYIVRFGALQHSELNEEERVRFVEDTKFAPIVELLSTVHRAKMVLSEAGLLDEHVGRWRGGLSELQWVVLEAIAGANGARVSVADLMKRSIGGKTPIEDARRALRERELVTVDSDGAVCTQAGLDHLRTYGPLPGSAPPETGAPPARE